MSFFSKLRDRMTRSSSKIGAGLDEIVSEGAGEESQASALAPTAPPPPPEPAKPGILGRLFGYAAVTIESAGAADANLRLAYLTQDEARLVRNEILAAPEAHVMRKPLQPRLYLISDLDPHRIARRYQWLAAFHLAVFLGAAAASAWFSQLGVF